MAAGMRDGIEPAWEPQIAQYGIKHKSHRKDEGERYGDRESERAGPPHAFVTNSGHSQTST